MKRALIISLLLVYGTLSQAQKYDNQLDNFWTEVYLLENLGKLKSAQTKVDSLRQLERYADLTDLQVRAYLYNAKFRLLLEEDARLAVILELDSLIEQETAPQFFYHYLRAKSLNDYRKKNGYRIRNNGEIGIDTTDFSYWSSARFIEKIDADYSTAFDLVQNESIEEYAYLIKPGAENESFNFDLIDLLGQEMISFYETKGKHIPELEKSIIQWDNFKASDFTDIDEFKRKKLILLQRLEQRARQNAKNSVASYYAIERTKTFNFLQTFNRFNRTPVYTSSKELANDIEALLQDDKLDKKPVQLALAKLWHDRLYTYDKDSNAGILAHKWASALLANDTTSFESIQAIKIISSLEEEDVVLEMKTFEPSQTFVKINLYYKNLDSIQFRIYRSSPDQIKHIKNFEAPLKAKLAKQRLVRSWFVNLPHTNNYLHHNTETLIDPLAPGTYVIAAFSLETDKILAHTNFQVTDLNFMKVRNDDKQEMLITHRVNGKALKGVEVIFDHAKFQGTFKSDANGKIYLPANKSLYDLNPILVYKGDTTYFNKFNISNNYNRHSDKLNIQVNLLTDRSIYRPGQTMYFKGYVHSFSNNKKKIAVGEEVLITVHDS